MEYLQEIEVYLDVNARLDLKDIALEYVRGLSGQKEGVLLICKSDNIIKKLASLVNDKSELIRKETILTLINISAEAEGAVTITKLESEVNENDHDKTLVNYLVNIILDTQSKVSDCGCMLLCNLTRTPENFNLIKNQLTPILPRFLEAFTRVNYNQAGCNLNYLGPLFSNLSCDTTVQKWLCEYKGDDDALALTKVASFCHFKDSVIRRGGAAGTLRNVCFDISIHPFLLEETDILPYLMLPLAGNEDYDDDETDCFPPSLQYLPPEKKREEDPDIRIILLEALNRLCAKKAGREYLRKHGVYYILREYHKWEKDRKAILACENVVDILIRTEDEIAVENIVDIEIPTEYGDKFVKGDEEFINSIVD